MTAAEPETQEERDGIDRLIQGSATLALLGRADLACMIRSGAVRIPDPPTDPPAAAPADLINPADTRTIDAEMDRMITEHPELRHWARADLEEKIRAGAFRDGSALEVDLPTIDQRIARTIDRRVARHPELAKFSRHQLAAMIRKSADRFKAEPTDDELGELIPQPEDHDAAWHTSNGYVLDHRGIWVSEMLIRVEAARQDAIASEHALKEGSDGHSRS